MKKFVLLLLVLALLPINIFCESKTDVRNAFVPGLSASAITGFTNGKIYPGFDFHYAFVEGVSEARSRSSFGGYYEFYTEIGFYKELNSPVDEDIFFTYAAGVNLSFEKFIHGSRDFLIPYFGAKLGGIYFNNVGSGMLLEPVLGLVVLNKNSININLNSGLFLNTVDLSNYIGLHSSLVVNLNL
ncbi:hypothetical protein [Treponema zioleckii]|uniref:hypothetical protein n=1 Tax=Treponema zioleckii TaxID=331680 RepID=UPI00168B353F|nr:hypothetical protein [Treponema zioleckii]